MAFAGLRIMMDHKQEIKERMVTTQDVRLCFMVGKFDQFDVFVFYRNLK